MTRSFYKINWPLFWMCLLCSRAPGSFKKILKMKPLKMGTEIAVQSEVGIREITRCNNL